MVARHHERDCSVPVRQDRCAGSPVGGGDVMAHTPVPWAAHYSGVYGGELTGLVIAICYPPDRSPNAETVSRENAALIANAVNCHADLLAALKGMLNQFCLTQRIDDYPKDAPCQLARAAIEKAEAEGTK